MVKKMILVLLLGLLAACDGGITMSDVSGKWQLTSLHGQPAPTAMREGGVTLEIQPDGKFAGQAPVNRYFGQLKIEGEAIIAAPVGSTMMAGPPELMQAEQDFFKTLNAVKAMSVKDGTLEIQGADGRRLVFKRAQ